MAKTTKLSIEIAIDELKTFFKEKTNVLEELHKFECNLLRTAPEGRDRRFWCGFQGRWPGMVDLFQKYAGSDEKAMKLFLSIKQRYEEQGSVFC